MKIHLPVIGVRGDVQIFLALAKALIDRGHEPTVAAPRRFAGLARQYGIPFFSLGGGADSGKDEMQQLMQAKSTLQAAKLGIGFFFKGMREQTETMQRLCSDYDMIVGYGDFCRAEADKAGKPFVQVVIDPAMAQKRFTANIGANLGLVVEKTALYFLMGKEYARFRTEIDAPPAKDSENPRLILLPMSRHVVTPAQNWTDRNLIAGYWYLDAPGEYALPHDLVDFITAGSTPVFVTFGSAGWGEEPGSGLFGLVSEAMQNAGERALILTQEPAESNPAPDRLFFVREIPYSLILSRVSCVAHHCGMGTTAEVLRAGIPSIPVPHMVDQFAWAQRVHRLGVAVKPVPRKKLTARNLADAVSQTVGSQEMKQKAAETGEMIRGEKGVDTATEAIARRAG